MLPESCVTCVTDRCTTTNLISLPPPLAGTTNKHISKFNLITRKQAARFNIAERLTEFPDPSSCSVQYTIDLIRN